MILTYAHVYLDKIHQELSIHINFVLPVPRTYVNVLFINRLNTRIILTGNINIWQWNAMKMYFLFYAKTKYLHDDR